MTRGVRSRLAVGVTITLTGTAFAGCTAEHAADVATGAVASASSLVTAVDTDGALLAITGGATVIDVRTPEEFAAGHIDGALNIDVTAPDFADRVGELDPAFTYVVYCRSGSRAAAAMEQMSELGFDQVVNGGAYADLADLAKGLQN